MHPSSTVGGAVCIYGEAGVCVVVAVHWKWEVYTDRVHCLLWGLEAGCAYAAAGEHPRRVRQGGRFLCQVECLLLPIGPA